MRERTRVHLKELVLKALLDHITLGVCGAQPNKAMGTVSSVTTRLEDSFATDVNTPTLSR